MTCQFHTRGYLQLDIICNSCNGLPSKKIELCSDAYHCSPILHFSSRPTFICAEQSNSHTGVLGLEPACLPSIMDHLTPPTQSPLTLWTAWKWTDNSTFGVFGMASACLKSIMLVRNDLIAITSHTEWLTKGKPIQKKTLPFRAQCLRSSKSQIISVRTVDVPLLSKSDTWILAV